MTKPIQDRGDAGPPQGYTWLAWCQQCELKKPFSDYDERDAWVQAHRRETDHHVQSGAGKP